MEVDSNKDAKQTDEMESYKQELKEKEKVKEEVNNETIELDHSESEHKQVKDQKEKEDIRESNYSREHHDPGSGDIEMKFILDNKHLHTALSTPGSRSATPNTTRKRKNRHLDELSIAEMISLSGVESLCTISNYDAMSTRGFDDEEEEEGGNDEEKEVNEGIRVHHVLSILLAIMSVAVVLLLYFLVPCPIEPSNWSVEIEGIVSSSPVRLLDINKDGMDDVIFGFSIGKSTDPPEVKAYLCENLNLSSPCGGGVIAMDGWRGEVLWRLDINHTSINDLVCNQLDINKDGQLDCLAAGNNGLLMAINTKTGDLLWEVDPSITVPTWTYSQPQTLPEDLNDDGILDLVVSHGVEYILEEGGTGIGRLLLISGKTGESLGTFFEMPDGCPSVSPPIIFQSSDDDQDSTPYIVFGTGSASIPGSVWMVSLDQLLCQVTESDCIQHGMSSINEHILELIRGTDHGFILPAIVVDMTMDGVNDLIVISHDALVTNINGSNFKPLWSIQLDVDSGYRPHSIPAPGHFNSDEIPDLMIQLKSLSNTTHTNKVVILDGLTGGDLWYTMTASSFENKPVRPSPLSLKAQREKDAFTYWIENFPMTNNGITTQSIDRCSDVISRFPTFNMVIMDRDMAMDPPSIISFRPYKPITTAPHSPPSSDITTSRPASFGVSSHMSSLPVFESTGTTFIDVTPVDLTSSPQSSEDCYMMEPILTSTGIIDDFDDDGSLELIVAVNMIPTYFGSSNSPSTLPRTFLIIQRVSLEQALDQNKRIKLVQSNSFFSPSIENSTVIGNILDHFDFLETKYQTWLGYLGTFANGRYT